MKLKQTFSNHPSGKYSSLLSKINTSIFLPKFCNFNNSYINDYYLGVFTSLITIQQYIIIKVFICKNGSSHRRCSVKKGVLRSFTKFAGKYVCQGLFLIKVQALACNIIKNQTLAKVFSCEFYEISNNAFFTEHLRATVSVKARYRRLPQFQK